MSYPHDKEYGDQKQFPVPVLDNTEIVQKNGTVWSRKQSSWKKRLNRLLIKTNNLLNKIHSETLALLCTALKLLCHELFSLTQLPLLLPCLTPSTSPAPALTPIPNWGCQGGVLPYGCRSNASLGLTKRFFWWSFKMVTVDTSQQNLCSTFHNILATLELKHKPVWAGLESSVYIFF